VASDDAVRLLASIDRRLALLTAGQERDLRAALTSELLRTPARIAMFDGVDGQRTGADLAKLANVSGRAGQLFVTEFLELGLVRRVPGTTGRAVIVERDDAAIINWYLQRG
jgi:hypothetical protein